MSRDRRERRPLVASPTESTLSMVSDSGSVLSRTSQFRDEDEGAVRLELGAPMRSRDELSWCGDGRAGHGHDSGDEDEGGDAYGSGYGSEEDAAGTFRARLSSAAEEILAESFEDDVALRWSWLKVATTVAQAVLVLALVASCMYVLQDLFPNVNGAIKEWAEWANNTGPLGSLVFMGLAALLLLIPGVPGSLVCFSCGAVFPFGKALLLAAGAHHFGACLAFVLARFLCRTRFERALLTRPTLKNMSIAASIEQWKVTFLSRFIFMPVQIKNYLFGVLPVSFCCFFSMAFLGDFQSTIFSVYLGSLSSEFMENAAQTSAGVATSDEPLDGGPSSMSTSWLPMMSLLVAITMTTIASVVARRAYMQVLCELKTTEEAHGKGVTLSIRKRRKRRPSLMRSSEEAAALVAIPLNVT